MIKMTDKRISKFNVQTSFSLLHGKVGSILCRRILCRYYIFFVILFCAWFRPHQNLNPSLSNLSIAYAGSHPSIASFRFSHRTSATTNFWSLETLRSSRPFPSRKCFRFFATVLSSVITWLIFRSGDWIRNARKSEIAKFYLAEGTVIAKCSQYFSKFRF